MALSLDGYLRKARSLAKKDARAQAEKLYQEILQKFPDDNRAIQGLAQLKSMKKIEQNYPVAPTQEKVNALLELYNKGQLQQALRSALLLSEQYPQAFFIQYILGVLYARLGRHEQAIESYQKALQIKPGHADAHNNLANALREFGRLEDAIESFNRALQIKPDYPEAHFNLGNALKKTGASWGRHRKLQKGRSHQT